MKLARTEAWLQEGVALHRSGNPAAAAERYDRILGVSPRYFDALYLGGLAALQLGRGQAALALFERALAVSPRHTGCLLQGALALSALGRHAEAEARLRELAGREPRSSEAWDALGVVLQFRGQIDGAIAASRRAVELRPKFAQGWHHLGLSLLFADRPAEALECQERACAAAPDFASAHHGRGLALQHLHRVSEAEKAYGAALSREPGRLDTRSYRLVALHYLDGLTPERLFDEHREYGAAAEVRAKKESPAPAATGAGRTADARLRIAFLSPDLRTHSVAYFLEPLLRHLDPRRFEIVLYHDHFQVDTTSERLRGLAAVWRNFAGQTDDTVERQIRSDRPDILVDLAGHTGMNRLPLFARRLAPVQVTYLGYPDTTGLAAMDYRLVDAITDPPGVSDRFATEKLVRFAPTAWSYAPPADSPPPLRRDPETPVFGCFNNLAKVTDETLRQWAPLLESAPGARLRLKAAGLGVARSWLEGRFLGCGIDPSRVDLIDRTPGTAEHLSWYQQVDIALDTFPYNGTTTTCEALWMGVPVVTLMGDRHSSRVGASLLAAAGRPEWVASTWSNYRLIAASLARDTAALAKRREDLRKQLEKSALMDHPAQGARFGEALLEMGRARRAAEGAAA